MSVSRIAPVAPGVCIASVSDVSPEPKPLVTTALTGSTTIANR